MRETAVIWELQNDHLDEAQWMLEATLRALDSPMFTIDEVADGPERRCLQHIDGLIVAGPQVASKLLVPELLEGRAPARVAAATLALLYADDTLGHQRVLASLDDEALTPTGQIGVVLGLARCVRAGFVEWLAAGFDDSSPTGLTCRLECFVAHHVDFGGRLPALLACEDPRRLRAAAWLVRCCTHRSAIDELPRLMLHVDVEVCRAAIESGLIVRHPIAFERALELAMGDGPLRREALTWVALLGDARVHRRMLDMLAHEHGRADVLWALGFSGRRDAVDAAIALLADEQLGALAAELVCGIAGLSPVAEGDVASCWRPRRQPPEPPAFELDDLDADLEPSGDDLLPWPEPEAVAAWWYARRDTFDASARYLLGHGQRREAVLHALEFGSTRWRHPLALELAVRSQGGMLLEPLGPCAIQRSELSALEHVAMDWTLAQTGGRTWA